VSVANWLCARVSLRISRNKTKAREAIGLQEKRRCLISAEGFPTLWSSHRGALVVGLRLNASRMRRKEKALLMVEQDAPTKIRETRNQTFFQIFTAG
jgi:hypothetical protein